MEELIHCLHILTECKAFIWTNPESSSHCDYGRHETKSKCNSFVHCESIRNPWKWRADHMLYLFAHILLLYWI